MPDVPPLVTWISVLVGLVSLGFNVWQFHRAKVRDAKFDAMFKELIPTWHKWADSIRRYASDFEYETMIDSQVARSVIKSVHENASSLSDSLESVADTYLSSDELAEKKARRKEIIESIRESEQHRQGGRL